MMLQKVGLEHRGEDAMGFAVVLKPACPLTGRVIVWHHNKMYEFKQYPRGENKLWHGAAQVARGFASQLCHDENWMAVARAEGNIYA